MRNSRAWCVAALAMLPVVAIYVLHVVFASPGMRATGFLQHDQAYYMANARAAFDGGAFPFYGLPFSPDYTSPPVYFQPALLLLGGIVRATRADPGLVYALFGVIAGVVAFRLAIQLYAMFLGRDLEGVSWIGCVLFLWGGGVMVLSAVVAERFMPSGLPRGEALLRFDPFQGYWFLNLGRNMFYSTEALYHAIVFATIVLVLRRRFVAALALMALESASHPFTGLQLLAIVTAFCALEWLRRREDGPPLWFGAGSAILLLAHLGYYVLFLNAASPEHRLLQRQWALPWILPMSTVLAAYGPPAIFAVHRFWSAPKVSALLGDRRIRLALVWVGVSLVLAKHEWFLPPHQPLHFTRGYIWTALALLGAPSLDAFIEGVCRIRTRSAALLGMVALVAVAISDNSAWLTRIGRQIVEQRSWTLYVRHDADLVYSRLSAPDMRGRLLIANDDYVAYMALVYTPLRAWRSHPFNTPDGDRRKQELDAFFGGAPEPVAWRTRPLVMVIDSTAAPHVQAAMERRGYTTLGRYGAYAVMERSQTLENRR